MAPATTPAMQTLNLALLVTFVQDSNSPPQSQESPSPLGSDTMTIDVIGDQTHFSGAT